MMKTIMILMMIIAIMIFDDYDYGENALYIYISFIHI